jgi:hypothetical protein
MTKIALHSCGGHSHEFLITPSRRPADLLFTFFEAFAIPGQFVESLMGGVV